MSANGLEVFDRTIQTTHIWLKDIMAEIASDRPHYNTLSTIVRNLEEKGYVAHTAYGNTHQYYPIVKIDQLFFRVRIPKR